MDSSMSSKRSPFFVVFVFTFWCIIASSSLSGQGITTGAVAGAVSDPQGSLIPQAHISANNIATGAAYQGLSGTDGSFAVHDLPVGLYTVTFEVNGYHSLKVTNVQVNAGVT